MRPSTGETVTCCDMMSPCCVRSDDLEVACQLPVGDRLAELPLLPLPRRGEVVDEGVAEPIARHLRLFQALRRIPESRRECELGRHCLLVRVALHRRVGLQPVLDP